MQMMVEAQEFFSSRCMYSLLIYNNLFEYEIIFISMTKTMRYGNWSVKELIKDYLREVNV